MPKTSVVVPVYNVQDYLENCVRSILNQTEKDLEILLIDDGSTDGSSALCDRLAAGDPRVRAVHQENRGLGGARNTGIDAAAGDWLMFVDSDDTLEPRAIEACLKAAEEAGAGIAVGAFRTVDPAGRELAVFREELPLGERLALENCPELLFMTPSACAKLYRAGLFKDSGLRYPPRVWYEDIRTTLKLLPGAGGVAATDYICYNYLQRPGSIMNNMQLARNREIIDAFDDLLGWFQKEGLFERYREELGYLTLFHVYLTASVRVLRADRRHPLLEEFRKYAAGRFPDYRNNKYLYKLGKKRRLLFRLLERRMYWAVALLFKIKG